MVCHEYFQMIRRRLIIIHIEVRTNSLGVLRAPSIDSEAATMTRKVSGPALALVRPTMKVWAWVFWLWLPLASTCPDNEDLVPHCASQPRFENEIADSLEVVHRHRHRTLQNLEYIIPVYFHVIFPDANRTDVERSHIEQSVSDLNTMFRDTPFQFRLRGLEFVINRSWYRCPYQSEMNRLMNINLHQGGTDALNVIVCDPRGDLSGWSSLPQWMSYVHYDPKEDGVFLSRNALPEVGRLLWRYTLVHEVGHWLGLYHTFEGGCTAPGDGVADTPAQLEASTTCNTAQNTCPDDDPTIDPGFDDTRNWMDYCECRRVLVSTHDLLLTTS